MGLIARMGLTETQPNHFLDKKCQTKVTVSKLPIKFEEPRKDWINGAML